MLLDEPETSLHPGAQVKLIEYLLRVVKDKKIQVLISTHSPTFVEKLPLESLIVLDENDQGTIVRNNITKATAFDRLGQYGTNKILLLTEDELCKALVERSVDHIAPEFAKLVVVEAANVGASEMLSNQTKAYIQSDSKVIMILDGDQRPVEEMFLQKPAQLSLLQKEELIRQLKDLGVSISYPAEKNIDVWMDWCANHVVLIEETCPEQVLLKLLKNNHPMLSSAEATNSKFKDAVRKQLYRTRDKLDSSAQYNILRYELGRLSEGSDIRESLIRL